MNDFRKLSINGYVTIKNGDRIIVDQGKNAIVRQGMRHFITCMSYDRFYQYTKGQYIYGPSNEVYMRFGKGVSIPTTQLTDDLSSVINLNNTTISNETGVSEASGSNKVFTRYVATWSAGSLNATLTEGEKLGELGLYMKLLNQFGPGGDITGSLNPPVALFSRFNLGTDAFVPDPTKIVIVEWEFRWEFI